MKQICICASMSSWTTSPYTDTLRKALALRRHGLRWAPSAVLIDFLEVFCTAPHFLSIWWESYMPLLPLFPKDYFLLLLLRLPLYLSLKFLYFWNDMALTSFLYSKMGRFSEKHMRFRTYWLCPCGSFSYSESLTC